MLEYLSSNLWLVWTLACVFALILEVTTGTFYPMCFALGAACSIIASLLFTPLWIQVLVFAIGSALCVFGVRPFAMKYLHPHHDDRPSNADALIGRTGIVIEPIGPDHSGYVKVDGDEWKAIADTALTLDKGTHVKIVSRDSIIVKVVEEL